MPSLQASALSPEAESVVLELGLTPIDKTYVSTPITTGRKYLHWLASPEARTSDSVLAMHRARVIRENIESAASVMVSAEARFGPIINPTLIHRPQWEQSKYHEVWVEIIEAFAERIVFVDGWQYSNGCSLEFLAGLRTGVELLGQTFESLNVKLAVDGLLEAAEAYRAAHLDSSTLDHVLSEIEAISVSSPGHASC